MVNKEQHNYRRAHAGLGIIGILIAGTLVASRLFEDSRPGGPIATESCRLDSVMSPPDASKAYVFVSEFHLYDLLDAQTATSIAKSTVSTGGCRYAGRQLLPANRVTCQVDTTRAKTLKLGDFDIHCSFVIKAEDGRVLAPSCDVYTRLAATDPKCNP